MSRDRLLALALFISVAVNIFAVSVFLGPAFHSGPMMGGGGYGSPHGPGHGPRDGHGLGARQLEHLSDETRDDVREIWRAGRHDLYREFRAMRAARRAVTEALTAPVYDEQAVIAAQADLDAAMDRMRRLTNQAVLDSARLLSDEEREAFFEYGFFPDRPGHHKRPHYNHGAREGGE